MTPTATLQRRTPLRVLAIALAAAMAAAAGHPVAGCREERRVPYIPPTLHNWEHPYRGHPHLELHAFHVGRLGAAAVFPQATGGPDRPLLAFVLRHPKQGLVVIDTGLNHRIAEDGTGYLKEFPAGIARVALDPGQDLPSQMRVAGLDPEAVRWVVLTNLRFPHAGEAEAFTKASVVVTRDERAAARAGGPGYAAREFDDVATWELIDLAGAPPLGTMSAAHDLFGDGSCVLLDARGPTAGNVAVLIRLAPRPVVLAGDLAPDDQTLRYASVPTFGTDADAWWNNLWRLKRFKDVEPLLVVLPGRDLDALRGSTVPALRLSPFAMAIPRPTARPTRSRLIPGLP